MALQETVSFFTASVAQEQLTLLAGPRSAMSLLLVLVTEVTAMTLSSLVEVCLAEPSGRWQMRPRTTHSLPAKECVNLLVRDTTVLQFQLSELRL